MANTIKEQRLIDTTKRALLKYTFVSDGTAENNSVLVDVSTLRFALNANGYIMSSNTHPRTRYNTTIKRIHGATNTNGSFWLRWSGSNTNNEIVSLYNTFDYNFDAMGDGAVISNPGIDGTGDILIATAGVASGETLTLLLDIRKDNRDYDAGQTARPKDFNR